MNIRRMKMLNVFLAGLLWILLPHAAVADDFPFIFYEDFNGSELNATLWRMENEKSQNTVFIDEGRLIVRHDVSGEEQWDSVVGNSVVWGDFDVEVAFDILDDGDGASPIKVSLNAVCVDEDVEISVGIYGNLYLFVFPEGWYVADRHEMSGRLKISRRGALFTGYYHNGSGFVAIGSEEGTDNGMNFNFNSTTMPSAFTTRISFDDFMAAADYMLCPSEFAPYSFDVEYFSITGNLPGDVIDEFDDGAVWEYVSGTAFEQDGGLTLMSPGESDFDWEEESGRINFESASAMATVSNRFLIGEGYGNFDVDARYNRPVIGINQGINIGVKLYDRPDTGSSALLEFWFGIPNLDEMAADVAGFESGPVLYFEYESDPLEFDVIQTEPVDLSSVPDYVVFRLHFDDDLNQFSALVDLGDGVFKPVGDPVVADISTIQTAKWFVESIEIQPKSPCRCVFDTDRDIDGTDIAVWIQDDRGVFLEELALWFGQQHCLEP